MLKDGRAASEEELRAHCKQALAAFKVPVHFRIMARADLPVTATGKVQKFRLQELLAERAVMQDEADAFTKDPVGR